MPVRSGMAIANSGSAEASATDFAPVALVGVVAQGAANRFGPAAVAVGVTAASRSVPSALAAAAVAAVVAAVAIDFLTAQALANRFVQVALAP